MSSLGCKHSKQSLTFSFILGFKSSHVGQSMIAALLDVCHTLAVTGNEANAFAYY